MIAHVWISKLMSNEKIFLWPLSWSSNEFLYVINFDNKHLKKKKFAILSMELTDYGVPKYMTMRAICMPGHMSSFIA